MSSPLLDNMFFFESTSLKIWYLLQANKRSCSVHEINQRRQSFGEFHHLYKELRQHPEKFQAYYRMNTSTFDYILAKISDKLIKKWTNFNRQPIEPVERLTITLRYLATGSSFRSLGFTFRMGSSTIGLIVKETVEVIWNELQPVHMKKPTEDSFKAVARDFYDKWNFPNCLGAIDGKHIRVKCPPHSGTMFYNYKHFFSIVLQGIADANYKFIIIDVGGYGKQSDGGTFRASSVFNLLQANALNIPTSEPLPSTEIIAPYVFIADEAYPLLTNLLKPYSRRNLDAEKEYFNMRLSRARRLVECAFGIINAKFRILWKPIETTPALADKIIKCICILHNIIIDMEDIESQIESLLDSHSDTTATSFPRTRRTNRPTTDASFVRDTFKTFVCRNRI